MPQDLPDGLQTFLKVVLGQPWPEGDVGQLRELSRAWQTYHNQLEDLIKGFRSVGNALDQAMEGDAADQWISYLQTELPSGLTDLLAITQNFADGALNTAADIDEARIMIGIQAAITMAAVAYLLATIFGAVFVPAVISVARLIIQILLDILLELVLEVVLGFVIPLVIEAWQTYVDHTRTHIDWDKQWKNLGSSIVGGLAAGFGKVAANFVTGHLASKLIGNQLKFTLDRSGQGIRVEGAGFKTFYFVNNATWQGLGGVVAASADMAIQGGEFNWGTVTASAILGAAEGTDRPYGLTGLIGNVVERIVLPQSVQVSNGPLNAPDTVYPAVAAGTGWETQPATQASGVEAPRAPSEPVYPPVSPGTGWETQPVTQRSGVGSSRVRWRRAKAGRLQHPATPSRTRAPPWPALR